MASITTAGIHFTLEYVLLSVVLETTTCMTHHSCSSPTTIHTFLRCYRERSTCTFGFIVNFFTNTHSYNYHLHYSFCKHLKALSIPSSFFHNSALIFKHRTPTELHFQSFITSITDCNIIIFSPMRDMHDTLASRSS